MLPGGPADTAGLRIQDIILGVDGTLTGSLPLFDHSLYMHKSGEHAKVEVLRGSDRVQLDIPLIERMHKEDSLADIADPTKNLVRPLSILGIELDPRPGPVAAGLEDSLGRHRGRPNAGLGDC